MERKNNKQPKLKIRKGDLVQVIAGDSKGKQGKVLEVILATNRIVVEGANLVSKHTKPNAANPNGGIVKQEAAIHVSNLMVVDAIFCHKAKQSSCFCWKTTHFEQFEMSIFA